MGLTATEFKTRWRNHQMSFKHEKKRCDTELSKYLWELKTKNEEFILSWKILAKARAYSNLSKRCKLCIEERGEALSHGGRRDHEDSNMKTGSTVIVQYTLTILMQSTDWIISFRG